MFRCKAPDVLRNESYFYVRRSDEGRGKRRRWMFLNSLTGGTYILHRSEGIKGIDLIPG